MGRYSDAEGDPHPQLLGIQALLYVLNWSHRLGCRSRCSAFSLICRTRSRVRLKRPPI